LIGYDGSAAAASAISMAGEVFAGRNIDATVVSVWEPLMVEAHHAARFGGGVVLPNDVAELDEQAKETAQHMAERGAVLAAEVGVAARPLAVADTRSVAEAIVATANQFDANIIVLGERGLSGLKACLSSVSNHVLQHAHRPLLIVPENIS
jgi:nucleotide-binding universal stress UspA family protein